MTIKSDELLNDLFECIESIDAIQTDVHHGWHLSANMELARVKGIIKEIMAKIGAQGVG